jgi:AbrB family looped-hinge helix DNA binding protein
MTNRFKLTVKSQVTVPKDVRDALGLKPGDSVTYDIDGDRVVLRKGEDPDPGEDFDARLLRALELSSPLPMEMSTDEYMAMIREPVPIPHPDDLRR